MTIPTPTSASGASSPDITQFTFHSPTVTTAPAGRGSVGCARNPRQWHQGAIKVMRGALFLVVASVWVLLALAVLDEASEQIRVHRETQAQIQTYNKSIADMEAILKKGKK